jgi:Fe-S-cluster-containing hydrogenase component 2
MSITIPRIFRVSVPRCIACGKCELACAFAHGHDGRPGTARIRVLRRGPEQGIPLTCLQCVDAACVAVCPVGALSRDPESGAVLLSETRCVRCGLCLAACFFGNMVTDDDGRPAKCDLCGGSPRCVPFCPTAALEYLAMAPANSGLDRPADSSTVAGSRRSGDPAN